MSEVVVTPDAFIYLYVVSTWPGFFSALVLSVLCQSTFYFCLFLSRCMAQKRQLLWQQSSHPHDAVSFSRGPGRLPAGSASG